MEFLELPLAAEIRRRLSGHPLMLLLDIDGTLSPIAPRPEYAIVPGATQRLLHELTRAPDTIVAFVTGRSAEDGRRLTCVDDAWMIGNHGIELAAPKQQAMVRDNVASFERAMSDAAERVCEFANVHGYQGVIVENKRWTTSVHYRLAHPRIVPDLTARVETIARDLGLRVTHGKEVLELRPPLALDKGTAAVALAEQLGATHDAASILAAGDDRTDEDMFRAVRRRQPRALTVRIGAESAAQHSEAEFHVPDTEAMHRLLEEVLRLRRDERLARSD